MRLRHQLIYLHSHMISLSALTSIESEPLREAALAWLLQGLPAIYPRQQPIDELQLALTILKNQTKHRVSFSVDPAAIHKESSLPSLHDIAGFFNFNIKSIPYLNAISVYGSFLFESLSQQKFITDSSDLDILIQFPDCSLLALHDLLKQLEHMAQRRVDAEIRFQELGDIAVRELLDASTETCLVKSHDHVYLLDKNKIYEHYPQLCS